MLSTPAAGLAAQSHIPYALTPSDRTAVQHYTLTESVFQQLLATARDAKANQIPIDIVDRRAHSLDETAAHLEQSASVRALLNRHGLSAHNFVLGEYALLSAEFAVKYAGQPSFDASMANQANIALYKRHEAELDALSGEDANN
ncbi:hypothetical protein GCM10007898_19800 [Dyella flagellata]|uniref:Outer membrane efflux protein n=2 Tax=Dyella flagellata TaxID=1867833 RepID=A0ABQ5XB56_9GAMM|nr:hypothetical protein GCM10007898_19800 [Dyella flagellata]